MPKVPPAATAAVEKVVLYLYSFISGIAIFANVAVVAADTTIAAADYNLGTLDNSQTATTGTLISGLTANLNKPGDKLTVGFDIANAGTIDATLTNFSKHITKDSGSASTADINDVVEYTIDCASGANLTNPNLNKRTDATHPTLAHCTLKVEYKENTGSAVQQSQTPGQDQTVNQSAKTFTFDADWSYAQR